MGLEIEEIKEGYPEPSVFQEKKFAVRRVYLKDGFERSHWYKFQVAAKMQLSEVLKLTASL